MGFICHECHEKLHQTWQRAIDEYNRRRDNGENPIDMIVEYENESHALLKSGASDTERYYFLQAAIGICNSVLASQKVYSSGWMKNYSGFWVKKAKSESAAKAVKVEPKKKAGLLRWMLNF